MRGYTISFNGSCVEGGKGYVSFNSYALNRWSHSVTLIYRSNVMAYQFLGLTQ
jgi:hypothetical protein